MSVWVTGGLGFIGSHLIEALLPDEIVWNLDALTYAASPQTLAFLDQNSRHHWIRNSLDNSKVLLDALRATKPKIIYHLAAETHVDRSITSPSVFIQSNVVGTQHLLEACLAYWQGLPEEEKASFRWIQVSTDEVFGQLKQSTDAAFQPSSPYLPRSPYAASKAAADQLCLAYHSTYGLPVIITHSSNNYGPRQFPEKLIPLVIQRARQKQTLPLYGDGQQRRDWIYVTDHIRALMQIAKNGSVGMHYLIGADDERTNLEVMLDLCIELDAKLPNAQQGCYSALIRKVTDRPGHDFRYAVDASKTRALGWQPHVNWGNGLSSTVEWYLKNPAWFQ